MIRSFLFPLILLGLVNSVQAAEFKTTEQGLTIKVPTSVLPVTNDSLLSGERCYGVSRRGEETGLTLSENFSDPTRYRTIDGDRMAWIILPFGICERLVRGALLPQDNFDADIDEFTRRGRADTDDGEVIQSGEDLIEQRINDFLYQN